MKWHPCPCWCTGWLCFDQWRLALGGGAAWVELGGKGWGGGGLNLPLVLMKTNELTRHDGIAFAKRGAEWCIVILCWGRLKGQVDLLFQQQIATVLPPFPPYLFTGTLRSLITAPSLLHSLIHVLIRRVIPHIIHPRWQRTTVYIRQSLRGGKEDWCPKCHSHVDFAFHYHLIVRKTGKKYRNWGRVMKPGNWRSKKELEKRIKQWMDEIEERSNMGLRYVIMGKRDRGMTNGEIEQSPERWGGVKTC